MSETKKDKLRYEAPALIPLTGPDAQGIPENCKNGSSNFNKCDNGGSAGLCAVGSSAGSN